MARKNSNAGQPNRAAQITRRSTRISTKEKFHGQEHHRSRAVMGPGSENISPQKTPHEVQTTIEFVVVERETVAA